MREESGNGWLVLWLDGGEYRWRLLLGVGEKEGEKGDLTRGPFYRHQG
jgi:hypothetical protein